MRLAIHFRVIGEENGTRLSILDIAFEENGFYFYEAYDRVLGMFVVLDLTAPRSFIWIIK